MAIDLLELKNMVMRHQAVVRIVITDIKGSTPRGVGTSMLVWATGESGTIGGGALEYQAIKTAREALTKKTGWTASHPLGPDLGQCCGGFVKLAGEYFEDKNLPTGEEGYFLRVLPENGANSLPIDIPLVLRRQLSALRREGRPIEPLLAENWFLEPLAKAKTDLWIWGAGHVGRALVDIFSKLPDLDITWIDTAADRFPEDVGDHIHILYAEHPQNFVRHAPQKADHLVLTYSHALDLDLCHALLNHSFGSAGLIGSKTKWGRFKKRLKSLGHTAAKIDNITCPIGRREFGKHPQQIAISVASEFLTRDTVSHKKETRLLTTSGAHGENLKAKV